MPLAARIRWTLAPLAIIAVAAIFPAVTMEQARASSVPIAHGASTTSGISLSLQRAYINRNFRSDVAAERMSTRVFVYGSGAHPRGWTHPVMRPVVFRLGTGRASVTTPHWSVWGVHGAVAANARYRVCPSAAQGGVCTTANVRVLLSQVRVHNGTHYFRQMKIDRRVRPDIVLHYRGAWG
jgi:hypothetical protein